MIYEEKTSSVGARPELHKLLDELKKGDCLVVYKMDRIARSLKDLMGILERVQQAGANIRSLTEPRHFCPGGGLHGAGAWCCS